LNNEVALCILAMDKIEKLLAKSGFFEHVWDIVKQVPNGKVVSYGQIAALLGSPRAARTVGWALHSIPEELDLPWHRVINSQGRISIGTCGHSSNIQQLLLEKEGVEFDHKGTIDMKLFQWVPTLNELNTINMYID
jgi:methylated-DNA-protein-cysteine methyltransferase related protein